MTERFLQDTFDVQILMARSVKHCINFKEAKEEDLHRLSWRSSAVGRCTRLVLKKKNLFCVLLFLGWRSLLCSHCCSRVWSMDWPSGSMWPTWAPRQSHCFKSCFDFSAWKKTQDLFVIALQLSSVAVHCAHWASDPLVPGQVLASDAALRQVGSDSVWHGAAGGQQQVELCSGCCMGGGAAHVLLITWMCLLIAGRATTSTSRPRSTNQASDLETSWTSRSLSSGHLSTCESCVFLLLVVKFRLTSWRCDSVQDAHLVPQLDTFTHC